MAYICFNSSEYLFLNPTTELETREALKSLTDSAAGWDCLSPRIMKRVYKLISSPLVHIINRSFETGVFPDELKLANVTPFHKGGYTSLFTNYRPVSILPVFSKIFEKIMFKIY